MSKDMANMRMHGKWELKWETKESTLWVGMPKPVRKMPRLDTNIKIESIWSTTECNAKLK